MSTLWEKIKAEGGALLAHLKPFAQQVAEAEVTALTPLAKKAALEVATEAASSGNLNDFATAASATLIATAQQAEAMGIQAGSASLMAAVAGALHKSTEDAPAAATPPAQPTQPTTTATPATPAAASSGDPA